MDREIASSVSPMTEKVMMMVVAHHSAAALSGQKIDINVLWALIEGSDCEIH